MSNRTWFAQQQWQQWELAAMSVDAEYNSPHWIEVRKRLAALDKAVAKLCGGKDDPTITLPQDEPEDQAEAFGAEIIPAPEDVPFEDLNPGDADQ